MGFLKTSLWVDVAVMTSKPNPDLPDPYTEAVTKRMMDCHRRDNPDLTRKYNMHEDDMSFMKEVFMPDDQGNEKPRLPFNKYIVSWGYHPVCLEVMQNSKTESALHDMMKKYGLSFRAVYQIPRPDGTKSQLSVISGMMFYSSKEQPYEVMVQDGREDSDPRPYQTDEDLMLLIAKLLGETK